MPNDLLASISHYVMWKCDPARLGAVRLYQILWFSDLAHYRLTGRTITGATSYRKLQHGPVPKDGQRAIEALEREGKIARSTENFYGRPKTMFLALERPDLSAFTAEQISIVDSIAEIICDRHTPTSIAGLTHDAMWDETPMGADMPVGPASIIPAEITLDDLEWAGEVFARE